MNVARHLLPALAAAVVLVAGTHAVDARPSRPHLVTVTAPCSDPLVKVPEVSEPFRPGGASFSVGTRGDVEVSCPAEKS